MGEIGIHQRFISCRIFSAILPDESSPLIMTNVHSSLSSGLIDYTRGWAWQQTLLSRRLELRRTASESESGTDADCVLLLEHSPVYTLGRGADESHLTFLQNYSTGKRQRLARSNRGVGSARLLVDRRMESDLLTRSVVEAVDILADSSVPVMAPNGVPIYRVERGGEVTFHGPGQLVVYPLLDLRRPPYKQDLHWYLRMVEEVVIQTLLAYEIKGYRDDINTGVWVGKEKVAAIGVTSSRWITTHGFALNVSPDLSFFDTSNILPCGIEGRGVTSIEKILSEGGSSDIPTIEDVATETSRNLEKVFDIQIQDVESIR
jgi:lipoyl(octanoyl) transferase